MRTRSIDSAKMSYQPRRGFRAGRSTAAVIAFLALFFALLVFISNWYLIPSLTAFQQATHAEKRTLGAYAWLILMILLLILFAAMLLIFRVGRFFFPRPQPPRTKTTYVDAWAEAGRRASATDEAEPEEDDDTDEPDDRPHI